MHELTLAESAVELIEATARREGFRWARQVRLEVGALSCVEPEALRLAFASASLGSCAEGAELVLLHLPAEGRCPSCDGRYAMDSAYDGCPRCDGVPLQVVRGTELRVKDLDVE